MQTVGTPKKLVTFFPDQNGLAKPAVGPEQSGDTFASRFSTASPVNGRLVTCGTHSFSAGKGTHQFLSFRVNVL